jgi:hypothetical protein
MDLLRKISTKVIRQDEQQLKHELFQTIDTFLNVDRERPSGTIVAFDLSWVETSGRSLSVAWKTGSTLKAMEVDDGEGVGFKRSPTAVKGKMKPEEIIARGREVLEERGTKLPHDLLRTMWTCLGGGGPGAR